jgi:hypothetical protein
VILGDALLHLAQLQTNDLLERFIAHRIEWNDDKAAKERGFEYLVQLRLDRIYDTPGCAFSTSSSSTTE